jgi:hypothetical protein
MRAAEVVRRVRQRQVAARRHRVQQLGDDPHCLVVFEHDLHDRDQHHRHRTAEVQGPGGLGQDLPRVPEVRVDVGTRTLFAALQQCLRVGEDDRVVVHVDHPRVRRNALRDLVGVVRRRDAGADVEELADARLTGEEADRAGQERPVGADRPGPLRIGLQRHVRGGPVGREVVLPAQPVVIDARDVRDTGVESVPVLAGILRCHDF